MRSPNDLKPKSFSLNMTPLIDVVFLLIIFFIVSNKMMKEEVSIDLDLPSATTGKELTRQKTAKIIINVVSEESILLGTRPVSLSELHLFLETEKRKSKDPLEIRIRTNRVNPYQIVEPILVICARCGIGNVSFSVVDK